MHTYLPSGNERQRPTMVHRTQVMRFTFEQVNGSEWFSAHWTDDEDGVTHRCSFGHVSRFKAWLLRDQGYDPDEADALIERLRAQAHPTDDH